MIDDLEAELTAVTLVSSLTIASRALADALDENDPDWPLAWQELADCTWAGTAWVAREPDCDLELLRQMARLFSVQAKAIAAVVSIIRRPRAAPGDLARLVDDLDESMADVADSLDYLRQRLPVCG